MAALKSFASFAHARNGFHASGGQREAFLHAAFVFRWVPGQISIWHRHRLKNKRPWGKHCENALNLLSVRQTLCAELACQPAFYCFYVHVSGRCSHKPSWCPQPNVSLVQDFWWMSVTTETLWMTRPFSHMSEKTRVRHYSLNLEEGLEDFKAPRVMFASML